MEVHFLQAHQALTKTFTRVAGDRIEAAPYPHAAKFKSISERVTSLDALHGLIVLHASKGHCLLKGQLNRVLKNESRAGSTSPETPTEWLCIDVDGLAGHTPEAVLAKLGIVDCSYILQYSSSQGIVDKPALSCHIFVLLARPTPPSVIKQWLTHKNLTEFRDHITLTKSRCALHYPIDITACQNDKLIYIAPPKCYPPEINKFTGERIVLTRGTHASFDGIPDFIEDSHAQIEKTINTLRAVLGLDARKNFVLKFDGAQGYLPNPERATVTGVKDGRGFTYLNINGGDSWGYWHPDDNYEFIHNFKGEPIYRTQEFLPEYYLSKRKLSLPELADGVKHYVFRDPRADQYYAGWHNSADGTHRFLPVGNKIKLQDYMAQYGLTAPKIIPDWNCYFDPSSTVQVDPKTQSWNRFTASKYMTESYSPLPAPPPNIHALLTNVLGTDPILLNAFYNWLAFIMKYRRNTGTAWIFQGVPGTGKGVLLNYVIKPLIGATNYTARRMEELEDKFNGYLEDCLICFVDEVHIGVSKRSDIIIANIKNQISEPSITIRNMRQTAYETPSYLNWIMSSNMTTPIHLDRDDRRFNVGQYRKTPLRDVFPNTTALVQAIESELPALAAYLTHFQIDTDAVRLPVRTDARQDLIDNSRTSLDVVADAVLSGDLELLSSFIGIEDGVMMQIKGDTYRALIQDIAKTGRGKLTRDEIRSIFLYTVGEVPHEPAKFTRFLSHRGIKLKKIRVGDKTAMGIEVTWRISDALRQEILTGRSAEPLLKVATENDGLSGVQRSDG